MPLAGKRLMPREIAQFGRPHWQNVELVKMVATTLAESAGSVGAWHDNIADDGVTVTSRDCGLMQINLPAREIGADAEAALRTESLDPVVWQKVVEANVLAAYRLYEQPWSGRSIRRWQPWVAYTTGWATFPEWWVWHQEAGKPIGPWVATGRYLQQAIVGVANYHLKIKKDMDAKAARAFAEQTCAHFHVSGLLRLTTTGVLAWSVPGKPSEDPADGVGPRPVPNDGL